MQVILETERLFRAYGDPCSHFGRLGSGKENTTGIHSQTYCLPVEV